MKFQFYLLLIASTVLVASCKSDKDPYIDKASISGKWDIYDATRNSRQTTTLKDGFIEFREDGNLLTNILGDTTLSPYFIKDQILESSGDFDYQFKIEQLANDTLVLSGKMKVFDMIFYLTRSKENNP